MASSWIIKWNSVPTLDNLRNFFLTPTTEVLSFFQTRQFISCSSPHWTIFATFVDATAEMLSFLRQLRNRSSHELRRAMIRVVGNAASRLVLAEPRPDAIGNLCLVTNQR